MTVSGAGGGAAGAGASAFFGSSFLGSSFLPQPYVPASAKAIRESPSVRCRFMNDLRGWIAGGGVKPVDYQREDNFLSIRAWPLALRVIAMPPKHARSD